MAQSNLPKEIIVPEMMDPPARPAISLAKPPLPQPTLALKPLAPKPSGATAQPMGNPAPSPRPPADTGKGKPRSTRVELANQYLEAGQAGLSIQIRAECAQEAMAELSDRIRKDPNDIDARDALKLCARGYQNGQLQGQVTAPFTTFNSTELATAEHWTREGLFTRKAHGWKIEFSLTIPKNGRVAQQLVGQLVRPSNPPAPSGSHTPAGLPWADPNSFSPPSVIDHRGVAYRLGANLRLSLTKKKDGTFSTSIREFLEGFLGD